MDTETPTRCLSPANYRFRLLQGELSSSYLLLFINQKTKLKSNIFYNDTLTDSAVVKQC